jgi:voltage-gated potassium channel
MSVARPRTAPELELIRLRRRLVIALAALLLVTMTGVVGFSIIGRGRYGVVDAAYMTVITLTTVGYGEIIDMAGHPGARLFTMALLLSGVGIVAYTVPALAAFVIEGQLNHVFTRRKMQKAIAGIRDHFIVCGDTPESVHVADELLRTRRPMVFVAPGEAAAQPVRERGADVPVLVGDAGHDAVLLEAGIERAAGVVLAMQSEKDNLIGVLTARRLAPRARIVATSHAPETETKLRAVGADALVTPEHVGGLRLASVLVRPAVVTFLDTMLRQKGGTLRVEEIAVPSPAEGKTLASLQLDDTPGALLVAIRAAGSDEFHFKPAPGTMLTKDAVLVVIADPDGLAQARRRLDAAK